MKFLAKGSNLWARSSLTNISGFNLSCCLGIVLRHSLTYRFLKNTSNKLQICLQFIAFGRQGLSLSKSNNFYTEVFFF